MSDRGARTLLGAVIAVLAIGAASLDLPDASAGQFWSDGATYHAMAWSLAEDGDLEYEARDLFRVLREFPAGPQGIFLKRASGGLVFDDAAGFPWIRRVGEREKRIYFAKAFAYPASAAPLVRLVGTRGLLLTNALALGLALWLGYGEARRRAAPAAAIAVTLALLLATVTPVYVLWPTPEIFNLGVIAAGLAAWRRGRPSLSAVLLGIATYSKPYSLFLAIPLGVAPFVEEGALSLPRRLAESARRGLVLAATTVALFGLNVAATGEANYQGGERKTFYEKFPFGGPELTFGRIGIWMTTDHLGPLVEGEDEARLSRRTGPLRAPGEIRASFIRNLGYFWVGRFGGALAYFFPALMAIVLFLTRGPRDPTGWLALGSLAASYFFYIWMIPDNWYGGGGTVGNRYFLNLLPLMVYLVPRGREWLVAGGGLLGVAVFLGPILLSPLRHSLRPGDHATRGAFRLLPAELTMLNDLSAFTESWRKKRPFGDTEGDPHKHWPADPKAYYLYFLDNGSLGKDESGGEVGFWLRGGERAEVVLRALEPVRRMTFHVTGGPAGDDVKVDVGGKSERVSVRGGETRDVGVAPGPGFAYYDTFLHVLTLESSRGGVGAETGASPSDRVLGAFVRITLEVDKRHPPPLR